ncbi:MAG TPA: hypothetical protein VGR35_19930 [Tepidisphaeraceae bacterium]|nr:hypothetical protein [Tepidisphaeraceae bacterium]
MRVSIPCAAAAALLGSSLLVGCASRLPDSPVPAPLSDLQAIELADAYLDERQTEDERFVNNVEPTGDGNIVSFRSGFDPTARPPAVTRLIEVEHDGSVREIRFRRRR